MAVTIKMIAKHFGIGTATVSRAINNSGYVRQELKEAIQAYAHGQQWTPSDSALALKTGKSRNIGVLLPNAPYYYNRYSFLDALRCRLQEEGLQMTVNLSGGVERLLSANISTVLLVSATQIAREDIDRLLHRQVRVLGIFGRPQDFPMAFSDHFHCGYEAMRRLLEAGHRKVAFYLPEGDLKSLYGQNLRRGIMQAAEEAGVDFEPERDTVLCSRNGQLSLAKGEAMPELVKLLPRRQYSAFVVYPCYTQLRFYISCHHLGLRIPEDVSMVGCEGDFFFPALHPMPEFWIHNYQKFTDVAMDFILERDVSGETCIPFVHQPGNSVRNLSTQEKV